MENKYQVIFMVRERGAIGVFWQLAYDNVVAETPEAAHDKAFATLQKEDKYEPAGECYVAVNCEVVWPPHAKGKII